MESQLSKAHGKKGISVEAQKEDTKDKWEHHREYHHHHSHMETKAVLKEKKAAKQILEQREPDILFHSMGNAQTADYRDTAQETAQNLDWDFRESATNAE